MRHRWDVTTATDGQAGIAAYEKESPDLVMLDVGMPGQSGIDVLRLLRERDPQATVVMLSGDDDIENVVQCMQLGAEGFLPKPIQARHLEAVVERAYEKSVLRHRNRVFSERQVRDASLDSLGTSQAMREVARQIELLAEGNAPILLTGATGSGKGWIAKLVHAASRRRSAPFVALNCAGLSATFLDSELFGHEKGAFTDAKTRKQGLFEVADGGTIMLDEIGDLAPELQPKLLTVLESKRFRRLGGTHEIEVDVRLIAATHIDLVAAVKAGRFREDLYYRIAALPVHVPSLRERGRGDIVDLTMSLLGDLRRQLGRGPTTISPEALERIAAYDWPGNVRELRNVLERAMLLSSGAAEMLPQHLPLELRPAAGELGEPLPDDLSLKAAELRHIQRVLALVSGNRLKASKLLGMSRQTLYDRLQKTLPSE